MTVLHSINPASFWLGFTVGIVTVGVVGYGLILLVAWWSDHDKLSASIGAIRPRHWSERSETDEEPRFV